MIKAATMPCGFIALFELAKSTKALAVRAPPAVGGIVSRAHSLRFAIDVVVGTLRVRQYAGVSSMENASAAPSAHFSYHPARVSDMATLVLMARSACASKYEEVAFWRKCTMQAQRLSRDSSFAELARFVEAVAEIGFRDDEFMYNFGDAAIELADGIDSDTLASTLYAHDLLKFRNDRALQKLEESLYKHMRESRATAAGLARSLRSLARLHAAGLVNAPDPNLLEGVGRMASEHVSIFTVQQLCELLEAYRAYRIQGCRQTTALFARIANVLAHEAATLSATQCGIAASSYAKCRVHDEQLLVGIAGRLRNKEVRNELTPQELVRVLYGFAKFTCQDTALLDLLSIEARRRLHLMDISLMGSSLASLAKAGVSSSVFTGRAAVQLRRTPTEAWDTASMEDLSVLAMAFAKMQARDERLFDMIADAMLRKPGALNGGTCSDLINIVHAFTKVQFQHSGLFGVIAQEVLERFDEISPQDVVKFLHAAGKVDLTLPPGLRERLAQALKPTVVQRFGVFELLKLSTAARRLRLETPALETQLGAVLPNEDRGEVALCAPRRPTPPKRRRKSLRKRKWTW